MDYRDYQVAVKIYANVPEVPITIRLYRDRINVMYDFGSYGLSLKMLTNGDCSEIINRGEKVLSNNGALGGRFQQSTPIDAKIGKVLSFFKSPFLAGAGNGILGFGVTKVERFPDCFITLEATANSFFVLTVTVNSYINVLRLTFDAKNLCEA